MSPKQLSHCETICHVLSRLLCLFLAVCFFFLAFFLGEALSAFPGLSYASLHRQTEVLFTYICIYEYVCSATNKRSFQKSFITTLAGTYPRSLPFVVAVEKEARSALVKN